MKNLNPRLFKLNSRVLSHLWSHCMIFFFFPALNTIGKRAAECEKFFKQLNTCVGVNLLNSEVSKQRHKLDIDVTEGTMTDPDHFSRSVLLIVLIIAVECGFSHQDNCHKKSSEPKLQNLLTVAAASVTTDAFDYA